MSEHNDQPFGAPEPPKLPRLRPHLTVIRQITYQGDDEAIRKQLDLSLPDGIFLSEHGLYSILVETAPLREVQPDHIGVVKQELYERFQAQQARAEQAAQAAKSTILNPHTLRPVN
jgi:hypothetical protein